MKYRVLLTIIIFILTLEGAFAYITYGGSRSTVDDDGFGVEIDFALWPSAQQYFEQIDFIKKVKVTPFNALTGVTTIYWEDWVDHTHFSLLEFELNMFSRHYYNVIAHDMWSPSLPLYDSFYFMPNGQTVVCYPHYVSWMNMIVLRCDPY